MLASYRMLILLEALCTIMRFRSLRERSGHRVECVLQILALQAFKAYIRILASEYHV